MGGECEHRPTRYGDVKCSGSNAHANLDDILCALQCSSDCGVCINGDIAPPSTGNGQITLDDILAVLAAFTGADPCGCAP